MNSEQYELFISLLIGENQRLKTQILLKEDNFILAHKSERVDIGPKPTSNNVWKKLKRDKNGKFVKGKKK